MADKKHYKTIEEQKTYLVDSKRIDSSTIDDKIFMEKSYLSIITPYTDLVAIGRKGDGSNEHIYRNNTNFNEYVNWCEVDKYISIKLQNAIGYFENKLKLFLSDIICKMMSSADDLSCSQYDGFQSYLEGKEFLNFIPFDKDEDINGKEVYAIDSIKKGRTKAISTIRKVVSSENRSNNIIRHYRDKGYIPFWVLIHVLTLNELSHLFKMLKYEDKLVFLRDYLDCNKNHKRDVYNFSKLLYDITSMRNIINHYEPIIPYFIGYKKDMLDHLYNSIKLIWINYKNSDDYKKIIVDKVKILTEENEHNKSKMKIIYKVLEIIE